MRKPTSPPPHRPQSAAQSAVIDDGSHRTDRPGRPEQDIVLSAYARWAPIYEVVFAEPGDLVFLGARSLEGMNLRVDPRNKQMLAAGPINAAAA